MEKWTGRVALVTGASAGIGYAIAERLVKAGMVTIGCARNIQAIQELAEKLKTEKGKLIAIKCDLRKEEEILAMFDEIKKKHGGVDVCINNAGLGRPEPLFSGAYDGWRNMVDVNLMALAICSQEAFKSMKERGVNDGMIIHVCSVFGHWVYQESIFHFYMATKHAVRTLLQGMRNELREMNSTIRVAEVSPGVVETDLFHRMSGTEFADSFFKSLNKKYVSGDDVAGAVEFIMSTPPHVSVHDVIIRGTGSDW